MLFWIFLQQNMELCYNFERCFQYYRETHTSTVKCVFLCNIENIFQNYMFYVHLLCEFFDEMNYNIVSRGFYNVF